MPIFTSTKIQRRGTYQGLGGKVKGGVPEIGAVMKKEVAIIAQRGTVDLYAVDEISAKASYTMLGYINLQVDGDARKLYTYDRDGRLEIDLFAEMQGIRRYRCLAEWTLHEYCSTLM
jgi:hypothetical protein